MNWSDVGSWIVDNASTGGALVGSLMIGNVPGAIAAGASLVQSATGESQPDRALSVLQNNPDAMVKLRELEVQDDENIRSHLRLMTEMQLKDQQAEHSTTQETIRNGDNSSRWWVSAVRPAHATASLMAAIAYVFVADELDFMILGVLMSLPTAYAGLRQVDKNNMRKSAGSD